MEMNRLGFWEEEEKTYPEAIEWGYPENENQTRSMSWNDVMYFKESTNVAWIGWQK